MTVYKMTGQLSQITSINNTNETVCTTVELI